MVKQRKSARRGGSAAALLCAAAALLVAAPSAGLALGAINGDSVRSTLAEGFGRFTPASMDPRLAALVGDGASQMRFTPAGTANRPGRAITVAVRVDENTARAISVRQVLAAVGEAEASPAAPRLTPMRYNLGLSRGYQSFARTPVLSKDLNDAAIPDLAAFKPTAGVKDKPSRFNARIAVDAEEKTGRDKSSRDALGDQLLDVGGAFSITRNLDVTAGVRLQQDRDRIAPLVDGQQDSQAVYVGTQLKF